MPPQSNNGDDTITNPMVVATHTMPSSSNSNNIRQNRSSGDTDRPIKVIKSSGLPVHARRKNNPTTKLTSQQINKKKKNEVFLTQQALKQRRYERTLAWIRLFFFVCLLFLFLKVCLGVSDWLYSAPPAIREKVNEYQDQHQQQQRR